MLIYKAAYRWEGGVWLGEVRGSLAQALRDMAETNLMRGEALPLADAPRCAPLAELEEPIHLVLQNR